VEGVPPKAAIDAAFEAKLVKAEISLRVVPVPPEEDNTRLVAFGP